MEYDRFAALVSPHTGTMAWMAASLVGLADAEDAAQEALVRAWNGWTSLREERAVRTWLLRITVNVCHNWQNGRFGTQQRRTVPLTSLADSGADTLSEVVEPLTVSGPDALEHATFDLQTAMAQLPDDLRQVVALRYYADMDSTAISAVLEIPASTVRSRLQRALGHLRIALGSEENKPSYTTGEAGTRGTACE